MKIALVFPGYGSQFVGMGKELYDAHRIVQEYFEEASNCLDKNFVKLCFASSDAELSRIDNAYPALFLVECATYALLRQEGIPVDVVAGYDQGEYAGMYAGGGISFPDGLYLLTKYSTFYLEALATMNVGALRIIGVTTDKIEQWCLAASGSERPLFISAINSALDHVVAGDLQSLEYMRDLATADATSINSVSVEAGLHSPLMDTVVDQFKVYLEKVDFKDMTIPLMSSLDSSALLTTGQSLAERVITLINKPIMWTNVAHRLASYDCIVEVSPGTTVTTLLRDLYPTKHLIALNKQADIDELRALVIPSTPLAELEE